MKARVVEVCAAWVMSCALLLHVPSAHAQDQLKDDPRARQFFEVGVQAYAKGQYLLAIDAFKEAYAITERPGILFSLAQAHQRQFRTSGDEPHLTRAIDYYRRYLARVPSGGRRDEASASLNTLLVALGRLQPPNQVSQVSPARAQAFGKLLLSSPTPDARLTVNGEAVEALPTALELPPDKYRVVGSAPGFEAATQEVLVVAGSSVPLNLELRPLPSRLQVSGPAGAEVFVDGRAVGWLPLGPLTLPAGEHWIGLRRAGRKTQNALVRLQRGQTARLQLDLETTLQRDAAWVMGAGALVGLAATVPLAVLAGARDREASQLDERLRQGSISVADAERLNAALDERDGFRTGATIAGIATGALLGSALVLYFADTPAPPSSGGMQDSAPVLTSVRFQPLLGTLRGLGASGTF